MGGDEVRRPQRMYLTTIDVAEMLNLSRRTIEGWRVTGRGPTFLKVGPGKRARVVYRERDVKEFVELNEYTSTGEIKKR